MAASWSGACCDSFAKVRLAVICNCLMLFHWSSMYPITGAEFKLQCKPGSSSCRDPTNNWSILRRPLDKLQLSCMNPGILLYKPRMHSHSAAELVPHGLQRWNLTHLRFVACLLISAFPDTGKTDKNLPLINNEIKAICLWPWNFHVFLCIITH